MKRLNTDDSKADGKRAKCSLAFLGTCLSTVSLLSDPAAWRAAKDAAASGDVQVTCVKACTGGSTLCIQGSVTAPSSVSKVAAAAHTHPFPGQAQVQLLVDTRSGELLDADTSCCPGGYHAARGSFCPCVGALLLAAAQLQTLEHGEHQELVLPSWTGTDAVTGREHVTHMASKLQQLVQPGLLRKQPAELLQVLKEVEVTPAAHMPAKLKSSYYHSYDSGSSASPDVIKTLFLDQDEESMHLRGPTSYPLLVTVPCDLPGHDQPEARAGLRRGLGGAPQAAAAAAEAAGGEGRKGPAGPLDRAQLLAALGGSHLTSYMGKVVPGWYQRPKAVNWAYGLLLAPVAAAQASGSAAACSSSSAAQGWAGGGGSEDGRPLVAVTGLMRLLWKCVYVDGLPAHLRSVLLVAMGLRNLLLVVALPVWARKAVAAQLRAWQQGISETQACNPVKAAGDAKLVHVLRVFKEAEELCQHGWDHPSLAAALASVGSGSAPGDAPSQQQQQPAASSQQSVMEEAGLLLLRLNYLELLGEQAAYLDLAMAGKQWTHAVGALLRSGDRSQLQLAAEMLPRHISALPRRLDYMQQLLGLEELGAVERCELAARLLLSLRGDLVQRTQQPYMGSSASKAFWRVQLWEVPAAARSSSERHTLVAQLGSFFQEFFKLAAKAQFELAKEAIASQAGASGPAAAGAAAAAAPPAPAAAAGAAGDAAAQPAAAQGPAVAAAGGQGVSYAEAVFARQDLPQHIKDHIDACFDAGGAPDDIAPAVISYLREAWGERANAIWSALCDAHGFHDAALHGVLAAANLEPAAVEDGYVGPLSLDMSMLRMGEPAPRTLSSPTANMQMDSTGFVQACLGPVTIHQVEPFPLPDLLPLCGLAPAALHAVVEGALAPLVDAAFSPSTTSSAANGVGGDGSVDVASSRPSDLTETLLQVAGHPGVEYGGAAVRLQMAVEMVAYLAALTPLECSYDMQLQRNLYEPLLFGLLAMGQQGLAWMAAMAAYRVCPSPTTATYLLLLGIQRGYEAQAAAVDWILAKDWPQAAAAGDGAGGGRDAPGGSPNRRHSPTPDDDDSSVDTQQLLGREAAEALSLSDTASSRMKQAARYQAAMAGDGPAPQAADAPADVQGGRDAAPMLQDRVEPLLREYMLQAAVGAPRTQALQQLGELTGLPGPLLEVHLDELMYSWHERELMLLHDRGELDEASLVQSAAADIALLAEARRAQRAAGGGEPLENRGNEAGAEGRAPSPPAPAATLVLEHELLGVTGREWRERAVQLRNGELVPVTQYAAACGLHPDLVVRLALVQLGPGPTGAAAAPVTWDEWIERSRRAGMGYHGAGLPKPGATSSPIAQVVAPGASIQAVKGRFSGITSAHEAFAPWLLHWLEEYNPEPAPGSSSSTADGDATARVATLLRQLWQLLQGRSYSTWMFWLATALLRAGEEDTACQAAAQGLLPSACNFWDMRTVKEAHTSCFEALLPLLARSSNAAIREQAAATQLVLAQAPVPNPMLLQEEVLERLLTLCVQLVGCYMPGQAADTPSVPASCISLSTGRMSFTDRGGASHTWGLFMALLQRCVLGPLAAHMSAEPSGAAAQQQALRPEPAPGEETVVAMLERCAEKLHWSVRLCIARAAREANLIKSWGYVLCMLHEALPEAAEVYGAATVGDRTTICDSLEQWKSARAVGLATVLPRPAAEAAGWVNGILAWLVAELSDPAVGPDGAPDMQPPFDILEDLSFILERTGFCTPHVLLYVTAVLQATQGRDPGTNTRAIIPNGVLPLAGRPERIQAASTEETSNPCWAWSQPSYTRALQSLLQQESLLSMLTPATVRNMAVTHWVKSGSLEAMVWVGQILQWLQQQTGNALCTDTDVPVGWGACARLGAAFALPGAPAGSQAMMAASDVLSIQVHPALAPFLDLAPASGAQAAMQRFIQLQSAANCNHVWAALGALFQEAPEALAPGAALPPLNFTKLEEQLQQLESMFVLLDQQPYAASPSVSWLRQQPLFHNMQQLLRGVPEPSVLDTYLTVLGSPLLQLRVLQYKIWKMCKAIVDGPPCITERLPKTPAKPWDHQITVPEGFPDTPTYAAASCKAQWEALRDSDLQAAFLAARSAVPGPAPLPRSQMVGTVISYLEAQEVALAWAVVKYAELRASPEAVLTELRVLARVVADLGQLPVFMTQLGAAVKQQRARYPLYALFRPVHLPRDVHNYLYRGRRASNVDQLQRHLNTKFNRLALRRLMVQAMPWLDWQERNKGAEVRALAEWLWWLAEESRQQGVVGVEVDTELPARARARRGGWEEMMMLMGH